MNAAKIAPFVPADLKARGWMPTWLVDGSFCYSRPGHPLDPITLVLPDEEGDSPWGYVTASTIEAARQIDREVFPDAK